ncbi:hypothetical protein D6833_08905 [Candidatus Parcubacteria bacterium]|nr:MAG: hypothetical protein D6833_08905 [Candidatus Parcubacteria bacterium]
MRVLLSADTVANFQRRLDYLSVLAQRERELLETFRSQSQDLEVLLARQDAKRQELLAVRQQTENAIHEMKGVHREKQLLLASLEKEKDLHERMVQGLQQSAQRVDALLKELSERRRLAESRAKKRLQRPVPKGALIWPADGKVVSTFGRHKHPTFDTFVTKKGIEIEVTEGSPIWAVSSGTVVYADWLKGYGLVVILDHGNGFFSLYAHASKLLVKEGQTVAMGDTIGETGETGLTKGRTLYFELRKGTRPVDPLKWLVKRP